MDIIMNYVVETINELKRELSGSINAIETGTIRSFTEKHESTRHIASTLGDRGTLISVDIDPKAIEISKAICRGLDNIEYVQSDSIKYLNSIKDKRFDFALLDSVNNKDFIMSEFKAILPLMQNTGVMIIDDAGITNDGAGIDVTVDAQKAHAVWKLLYDNKIGFSIITTPLGHGTQLKIKLTEDKIKKLTTLLTSVAPKREVTFTANILTLNEEFWIGKQLEHIYDFFDEIIICDGTELKGVTSNHGFDPNVCSIDGLSTDNTKNIIKNFPDPKHKIKFIEYGSCGNKVDMCNEMYSKSTCDYVWQLDCDEFYTHKAMSEIKEFLAINNVNQINFRMYHFIDFNNCIHGSGGEIWGDNIDICRIFRNEKDNMFCSHRPPTIKYKTPGKIIKRDESLKYGWVMYHYSYVFDWQVDKKAIYYPTGMDLKVLKEYWKTDKTSPLLYGSRTRLFTGKHPEIIEKYLHG